MRRTWLAVVLTMVLALAGYVLLARAVGSSPLGALSASEQNIALRIAHHEARRTALHHGSHAHPDPTGWPPSIRAVTARVADGAVTQSNTGHECTSGTILRVTLFGSFAIVTSGTPGRALPVHAVDLVVDPNGGQLCLLSVTAGRAAADPKATVLFRR